MREIWDDMFEGSSEFPPLADRVAAGAALLDREVPGWADRIDLERLDLASSCNCVLGQLHDDGEPHWWSSPYNVGVDALFGDIDVNAEVRHGFLLGHEPNSLWAELDRLWAEQVRARQAVSQ